MRRLQILFFHSPSSSRTSYSKNIHPNEDNVEKIREAFQLFTNRKMAFCGEANIKKVCSNVYNLDLEALLDRTLSGKYKERRLTRTLLNKLSYFIENVRG